MKDFPVFTTEHGVGSLIFKEIPYLGCAFVKIHDASDLDGFLSECISFCRMAGAERVYASGKGELDRYPFHTSVYRMRINRMDLPETESCMMPVTEATLQEFQQLYNRKMKNVPNASFMTQKDAEEMLRNKEGYFIHKDGVLLGIGMIHESTIKTVISCVPGGGREVILTLNHALAGEVAELEVASENHKAIRLYESLGFYVVQELSRWYKIF